eukprot:jgi/Galph1/3825/GphlegSOOS_G2473.1
MPLLVLCGYPQSGKTTFTRELQKVCMEKAIPVKVVADDSIGQSRDSLYKYMSFRVARGLIRTEVERLVDKETLLNNFLKGFRYELFCLARALNTQYALLFCSCTKDQVHSRNKALRETGEDFYSEDGILSSTLLVSANNNVWLVLVGLLERFEFPDSENRWERPPFIVSEETDLNTLVEEVIIYCKDKKSSLRSVIATRKLPSNANSSFEQVEKITQRIENEIFEGCEPNIPFRITGVPSPLQLSRKVSLAELRKVRRSFIRVVQRNFPNYKTDSQVAESFVEYLKHQLG